MRVSATFLLAAAALLGFAPVPAPAAAELRIVQANVGNVNAPGCAQQEYKLCLRPVEARAAAALGTLAPDVVALEEILPAGLCRTAPSAAPANLCSGPLAPPSQVTRLLGDDFVAACDNRFGWDCVAVRRTRALLAGSVATRPVLSECEDAGFTLNTARMRLRGWPVSLAVAQPDSLNMACRAAQVRDLLGALPARAPAIVMGDFSLDPYRESDASVAAWQEFVPSRFVAISSRALTSFPGGASQFDPTGATLDGDASVPLPGTFAQRSLDHVLVGGSLGGACAVQRIDGGGGMDHRAQVCRVTVPDSVTPRQLLARSGCVVGLGFSPPPRHLTGVRFAIGRRTVLDRHAPFRVSLRPAERTRRNTVKTTAILTNGEGPAVKRVLSRCKVAV